MTQNPAPRSFARNFDDLARARRSSPELCQSSPELACMSTKLTRHIFLRLAGPNKGPECCLGGAGHVVVPLFGVGGTPRGISFLPPKLMKINFKARKKKKALWAPCTPDKGTSECPATGACSTTPLAIIWASKPQKGVANSGTSSWHPAPASSGTAPASSANFARRPASSGQGPPYAYMV